MDASTDTQVWSERFSGTLEERLRHPGKGGGLQLSGENALRLAGLARVHFEHVDRWPPRTPWVTPRWRWYSEADRLG